MSTKRHFVKKMFRGLSALLHEDIDEKHSFLVSMLRLACAHDAGNEYSHLI